VRLRDMSAGPVQAPPRGVFDEFSDARAAIDRRNDFEQEVRFPKSGFDWGWVGITATILKIQLQSFHRLFLVFAVAPLAVIGMACSQAECRSDSSRSSVRWR
jgi:hypothetical protein